MSSEFEASKAPSFLTRFWPVWMVGGVVLVLAGTAFFWRLMNPHQPEKTVSTLFRTNLVLRSGAWYDRANTNRFTGWMVQAYPDGSRMLRIAVSNGLLNGVCESWFTNGQPQSIEHFKNGVSDGQREKWYANGQIKSRAEIVHGKMEGIFQRWYENGQLAEWIPMTNGSPNGMALEYFPSGFAKTRTQAILGRIQNRESWKDGEHRIALPSAIP